MHIALKRGQILEGQRMGADLAESKLDGCQFMHVRAQQNMYREGFLH